MPRRMSAEKFIERASQVHRNKYCYSGVVYVNTYTRIDILCPTHGTFTQVPKDHLGGAGCKECSNIDRKNTNFLKYGGHPKQTKEVQDKFKKTCLDRYGVENPQQNSDVKLRTKQTMIERYGVEHPLQHPDILEKTRQTNLERFGVDWTTQSVEVVEKKTNTWIKKYGVDNPRKSVQIKEKIKQTNLEKYGCHPKQTQEIQDKFKKTCLERYGVEHSWNHHKIKQTNLEKYGVCNFKQQHLKHILPLITDSDWLLNQYINQNKTAKQIAYEYNISDVSIGNYLKKAEIQIKKTYQSYISKVWLESLNLNILYEYQWNPTNKRLKADGYCIETNTIYEFHGDYWHGNPGIFKPNILHPIIKKSMGELYQNTIERENKIKELGYNLVVMWESDFVA